MEARRCTIQMQCSLIKHEQSRFADTVSDCLSAVLSVAKTASRSELQQLSQLNTELSNHVTAAADKAEVLQQQLELLTQQQSGRPLSGTQSPAGDSSIAAAESGSFYSVPGRPNSVNSVGSLPHRAGSQGRRSSRNVALRHFWRDESDPLPGLPAQVQMVDTSVNCESPTAAPVQLAFASASVSGTSGKSGRDGNGDGDGGGGDAASDILPERRINLGVMYDVTLAHHDEMQDCDLLHLNLREDEPSLDTLCHDLEALSDDPRYALPSRPRTGDLVFARWDGAWYRGRVTGTFASDGDSDTVDVQFVDYGNCDTVLLSECRRLPERLARMPVCAVQCRPAAAVAAPAGWQRQLQVLLIEALLPAAAPVQALFQRPSGDGPLLAQLTVTATVGSESKVVDVGRTLNNVMAISLQDAREQVESKNLTLERLLEPFKPPQGRRSRILDWLSATPEEPPSPGAGPELQPPLLLGGGTSNGRVTSPEKERPAVQTELASVEPAVLVSSALGSPVKTPQTFIDPPKYRHLTVCWGGRPIHRSPLQFCSRKSHRDVIIVKAQSPEDFYISFESQDTFEEFQGQMQAVYGGLPAHPRQGLHRDLLAAGSYWAARYDGDEWCRAVILEELELQCGDGVPSYRVRAVDFGDDLVVPAAHLRPMLEQFASQPVFIVRATCSGVAPLEGAEEYSEAAKDRFIDLVDVSGINAHTVRSETTPETLAVVLYKREDFAVVPVTQIMAQEGLVQHWEVLEDVCAPAEKPVAPVPAAAAPAPLEDLPVPPPPPPLTSAEDDDWQPGRPPRLPSAGAVIYVRVTAVMSPRLFYVVLPFGYRPAQLVNVDFTGELRRLADKESVETLAAALRRFYGPRPVEGALPPGVPPQPGSSVAVRWQGGWHRGTVLTSAEDHAEVFLVDWGHSESMPLKDLRELKPMFQRAPPQAVPCSLGSAVSGPLVWPAAAGGRLVELAQHGLLLAHVLVAPDPATTTTTAAARLLVDLYHATGLDGSDGIWASQWVCSEH